MLDTRNALRTSTLALGLGIAAFTAVAADDNRGVGFSEPVVLQTQGSFTYGGTVVTGQDGDTFHGDHGYVQYQIPAHVRRYPIVMWHGTNQFSKTWETTPDGRDGYQNIFLRRGFSTYILDQPRRGRAGRTTAGTTIPDATPDEAFSFTIFRMGVWVPPESATFFNGVQVSRNPDSLNQWWRQITPNTGFELLDGGLSAGPEAQRARTENREFHSKAAAALFEKTGPAILLTHSGSGKYGWGTAMTTGNVKAIVAYEPVQFVFPASEPPADVPSDPTLAVLLGPDFVSDAEFDKLTKIPIQIVFGDNIEFNTPSPIFGVEVWRIVVQRARQFADAVNSRGGNVEILFLPDIGIHGNTHFAFSDLNNVEVADQLSIWLKRKKLDEYDGDHGGN